MNYRFKNYEEERKWTNRVSYAISRLVEKDVEQINFDCKGINPAQLISILEALGYKQISFENHGWQQDTWHEFEKDGVELTLFYCGFTFDMNLRLRD